MGQSRIGRERVKMRVFVVCLLLCLLIERSKPQTEDYDDDDDDDEYSTEQIEDELTRLEAFFEQLERRILRLEEANNGTRGVTESVHESMTSPAPETTTYTPCCQKIKLKSRKTNSNHHPFLGVYQKFDTESAGLFYAKEGEEDEEGEDEEILS